MAFEPVPISEVLNAETSSGTLNVSRELLEQMQHHLQESYGRFPTRHLEQAMAILIVVLKANDTE